MTNIIGVAIGLCLLFLLMSILGSYLNEAIAAAFGLRAAFLELGLQRMLQAETLALKDKNGNAFNLVESIRAHPLILSLSQSAQKKPTYIPDHTFVAAMESVLAEKLGADPNFGQILAKLPVDSILAQSLSAVIRGLENDPIQCRAAVATWFNEAMDRVGGWYKRWSQVILFAVGVVVAVVLNADSLHVATRLWSDSTLRDQISVVASGVLRPASPLSTTSGTPPGSAALVSQFNDGLNGIRQTSVQLNTLPIGWDSETRRHWSPSAWQTEWSFWLMAICGWLSTAVAAALGAPFWFDLLGKAINMRMAGPAPQQSPPPLPLKRNSV
jgi:hypothetical protein